MKNNLVKLKQILSILQILQLQIADYAMKKQLWKQLGRFKSETSFVLWISLNNQIADIKAAVWLWKYVPSDKEDVNLKIFNMIPRVNEAKVLLKHIHVIVNSNSIVQNVIKIKNEIMINRQKQ